MGVLSEQRKVFVRQQCATLRQLAQDALTALASPTFTDGDAHNLRLMLADAHAMVARIEVLLSDAQDAADSD